MMTRYLHVLWAANVGPMVAYRNSSIAFDHARAMLGVEVTVVELRDNLVGEMVHIVWSPDLGPLDAYSSGGSAIARASRLRGTDVASIQVRERLSDSVLDDINSENDYEGEDDAITPVDGVVVPIGDIDDE